MEMRFISVLLTAIIEFHPQRFEHIDKAGFYHLIGKVRGHSRSVRRRNKMFPFPQQIMNQWKNPSGRNKGTK